MLIICSLTSLFQKEVACSSEYKSRVSAYCRKPADGSAASVLSEGNGNNGKKAADVLRKSSDRIPGPLTLKSGFRCPCRPLIFDDKGDDNETSEPPVSLPLPFPFWAADRCAFLASPFPVQPRNPCDCALPVVTSCKAWKYDSLAFFYFCYNGSPIKKKKISLCTTVRNVQWH